MPNVLVTGGLGFIGGSVVNAYNAAGWNVAVCDDLTNNTYQPHIFKSVAEYHSDVTDALSYARVDTIDYDLIVHCASPVGAAGVLPWRGNLAYEIQRTTHAVARYCKAHQARLINISTSEVYGFSGTYHEDDDLRVPARVNARIEYAVGKLAAETSLRLMPGLSSINVRPFNVVGADQRSTGGFVLPTFAEQAIEGRPLTVYGDGTQQRAFLAVEDLVEFMLHVTPLDVFDGRCVNVGNPTNRITVNHLANTVIKESGNMGTIAYTDGKAVHGEDYAEAEGHVKLPDISLAEGMGWHPERGLTEVVHSALEKAACR